MPWKYLLLQKVWLQSLPVLSALGHRRWSKVAGFLAATQATLLDADWHPTLPDVWMHPNGQTQALLGLRASAKEEIGRSFSEVVETNSWSQAAQQ